MSRAVGSTNLVEAQAESHLCHIEFEAELPQFKRFQEKSIR